MIEYNWGKCNALGLRKKELERERTKKMKACLAIIQMNNK